MLSKVRYRIRHRYSHVSLRQFIQKAIPLLASKEGFESGRRRLRH
jgi:hypothetical protein